MIFQKAIMEQGRGYVMDTVAELRERRYAVLELERSLLELHQVFLDMAVLVEAQGQMIDNIENQVWCFSPSLSFSRRWMRNRFLPFVDSTPSPPPAHNTCHEMSALFPAAIMTTSSPLTIV